MPITQDRMQTLIRLLRSAMDKLAYLSENSARIYRESRDLYDRGASRDTLMSQIGIATMLHEEFGRLNEADTIAWAKEEEHFRLTASANRRAAARKRAKRAYNSERASDSERTSESERMSEVPHNTLPPERLRQLVAEGWFYDEDDILVPPQAALAEREGEGAGAGEGEGEGATSTESAPVPATLGSSGERPLADATQSENAQSGESAQTPPLRMSERTTVSIEGVSPQAEPVRTERFAFACKSTSAAQASAAQAQDASAANTEREQNGGES